MNMEPDLTNLIANQIKLVEKAQTLAILELNEKTSVVVETHLELLLEVLDRSEIFWDDDDGEDEPVAKPDPVPEDSRKY